jgi:hypothetical protein
VFLFKATLAYQKLTPNNVTCLTKDLKTRYDCPFEIWFHFVGLKINDLKPLTFYQVKITHLNVQHTCKLSTVYHRRALQKGGRLCLDLSKLQTIILLLCEKPTARHQDAATLPGEISAHYKGVTAAFVSNFCKRVYKYWAGKGEDEELTMDKAQALASTSRTAAGDVIDMDDPIIQVNVGNMSRKTMQDSTSWKVLQFSHNSVC